MIGLWQAFVWWLLCAVGAHVPPPGHNDAMSISWRCQRCQERMPGGLSALKHKRRRRL